MKKRHFSNLLAGKTRSYSAQAAVTSLIIHVVLFLFAGSIVAVRYVQKQQAELIARTETRPKLERRKMQAVERVEQLQKKALTSKLISKKVSVASPEFVLPDTGRITSLKTQKLSLPGADAGRALKNLSRLRGIGPSRINFFGIRAESEKVVFVIEASPAMLDAKTGGAATYEYIKTELSKIVSEMNPAMLFNLVFYDQRRVFMFRPSLVPATRENVSVLAEWVLSVNRDPARPGLLAEQSNYTSPESYDTAVGADARNWLLALQAAMEQKPDTVLMLGSGWGHHYISSEKASRLLDFAMWELVAGNVISDAPALASDRKVRDDLLKEAVTTIQQEEKLRASKKGVSGFVRDIAQYVEYSRDQVLGHLDAVSKSGYSAAGLSKPQIHYVCLSEAASQVVAGGTIQHLRTMTANYNGRLDFFRRENPPPVRVDTATVQSTDGSASAEPAASVSFFGVQGSGSRIAFILDASPGMVAEETGGSSCYSFIKGQIQKSAEGAGEAQFNVILYNGRQIALFQPGMTVASAENIEALKEWLRPVNAESAPAGIPEGLVSAFPAKPYKTSIGTDASGWLLALQAAIEQQADAVFVAGSGWGEHPVSREKGRKLLDFSIWDTWSSGTEAVSEEGESVAVTTTSAGRSGAALGTANGMQQDKRQRDALLKEALKAIEKEDKARKAKGLPPPFVRDILSYLYYTPPQINEHLSTVFQSVNITGQRARPVVNFVCLIPPDSSIGGGDPSRNNLRKLTGEYGGNLVLFRGAAGLDELQKLNQNLDQMDWAVPGSL